MLVQALAKVNLFLEVLGKRSDGYHEILTLLAAVSLFDTLEFKEETTNQIRLTSSDEGLSTGPDNLVWRAADLLRRHARVDRGVHIHLTKRIPAAAGLAGGSSDAAATLIALDRLWRLGLSRAELAALAGQLGSDIPFFCLGSAAWCGGRGEQVSPFPLPGPLHLVLVCPARGLATAEVYAALQVPPAPQSPAAMRQALEAWDVDAIGQALFNRLEEPAAALCPAVASIRRLFDELRPAGHRMSGSGSSYFALCRSEQEAQTLARLVQQRQPALGPDGRGLRTFVVRTVGDQEMFARS